MGGMEGFLASVQVTHQRLIVENVENPRNHS